MKNFLNEYGFAILGVIVIILLITFCTPIGQNIKNSIINITEGFGSKTTAKIKLLDSENNENKIEKVYSLKESVIGTWIDGRPIYRIVIDFGEDVGSINLDVSELNIDRLIFSDCLGSDGKNDTTKVWTLTGLSGMSSRQIYLSDKGNTLIVGGSYYKRYAILEYIKTTDWIS